MRRFLAGLCAGLLVLCTSGCRERPKPPPGAQLTIAASSSCEPLARDLIALYVHAFPDASALLDVSNSRTAREAVAQGKAHLALVDDPDTAAQSGVNANLESVPVARDGVAIIVAGSNPVEELSLAQIRDIFGGQSLSWREVEGSDGDIQTVSREPGSGTRETFERTVMGDRPVTTLALVLPGSGPAVEYVAAHPDAIAYASTARLTTGVRALAIEGQEPDAAAIRSGAYPLTRLISAVCRADADMAVRAFIELAQSDEGQRAAEAAGYVGLQ